MKMWKSVKNLEEENKRLRQEREEWINRALKLSRLLHDTRLQNDENKNTTSSKKNVMFITTERPTSKALILRPTPCLEGGWFWKKCFTCFALVLLISTHALTQLFTYFPRVHLCRCHPI